MNDNLKRKHGAIEVDADETSVDESVEGHINFKGLEGNVPELRVRNIGDVAGEDELRSV